MRWSSVLVRLLSDLFSLIVTRRNEFLQELFRLLRSRDNIAANSPEDEDEELVMFLKRFDLNKECV